MSMNLIQTWQQGRFVDSRKYEKWTDEQKATADKQEMHLVRPGPTENELCMSHNPDFAKWIADRLNLASKLEQLSYDFATGKTDGVELVAFVQRRVQDDL